MRRVQVIAAGASQELVGAIGERLADAAVAGVFGAVGAMQERFLGGAACDVIVLTQRQIEALAAAGRVAAASVAPLGQVRTGIAVRAGAPVPAIGTPGEVAAALRASRGIYAPDMAQSTAGRHFMTVLERLGIAGEVAPFLRPFPNGATAMRHLAEATEAHAIGCTQVTEINYTQGLLLVGALPEAIGLATTYAAAVSSAAAEPELAGRLVAMLAGPEAAALRARGGFESVRA